MVIVAAIPLIAGAWLRYVGLLCLVLFTGTLTIFVIAPAETEFPALTLYGEFLLKDVVLAAATVSIIAMDAAKTLAHKHKTSARKIHKKYQAELDVNGKKYKGLQVTVPREGKKPLVATWGGIPLTWDVSVPIEDEIERYHWKRSEPEQRLLAQTCEQCEATRMTDKIEVHHVRALKDLNKYEGREKPQWVQIMAARRRKTLVLCHTCHMDIQHGHPPRRSKVSRSRTEEI